MCVPSNEWFLTVMITSHLFLAVIVHGLFTVVIHWMEGIISEGIEFLFWITSLFSDHFSFPVGYREKVGAACGCRHVPAYGSNRRYWLLAFAAFLTASTSPLRGTDGVWVRWSHRWEPHTKPIIGLISISYCHWVNLSLFLEEIVYAVSTHNTYWLLF